MDEVSGAERATAVLGGGCFWCLEAVYERLAGVVSVTSGYAGGHLPDPTYSAVTTGGTGHAEVVRVEYDPSVVSYRDLLEIFFAIHDPTTPDRQGHDVGPQYRSIILYADDRERATAEAVIAEMTSAGVFEAPIVTEVEPLEAFYRAEDYHQRYYGENPHQPYCQAVIAPKVAKLRSKFADRLRDGGAA